MMSRALEWPTLTTQWLPDIRSPPDEQYDYHRLLFGTHTSNDRPNYLQIAEVKIPHLIADPKKYDEERGEIGGHEQPKQHLKFDITQKILHPGEVNKARYMWQNPNIIATMCADGKTLIFDRTKHPLNPANETEFKPQIELSKHKQEGYGLHWSPLKEGHLATASIDGTVKLWDISQYTTAGKNQKSSMKAARTYEHHTAAVNDLEYHPSLWFALATVSDDQTLQILDQRTDSTRAAYKTVQQAHNDEISSVAWNPAKEMLLATGSADKTAAIWDLRNLKAKLHACEGHTGPVTKVEWHPKHREILATSAQDRRIIFWDLSQVGEEQTPENAEDGPPELCVSFHSLFASPSLDPGAKNHK